MLHGYRRHAVLRAEYDVVKQSCIAHVCVYCRCSPPSGTDSGIVSYPQVPLPAVAPHAVKHGSPPSGTGLVSWKVSKTAAFYVGTNK